MSWTPSSSVGVARIARSYRRFAGNGLTRPRPKRRRLLAPRRPALLFPAGLPRSVGVLFGRHRLRERHRARSRRLLLEPVEALVAEALRGAEVGLESDRPAGGLRHEAARLDLAQLEERDGLVGGIERGEAAHDVAAVLP